VVALVLVTAYSVLLVAKTALVLTAMRQERRRQRQAPQVATAEVSVLQPILSGDPDLEEALEHNLGTLGEARFIWLVDDEDVEAARITHDLQQRFPESSIEVVTCPAAPEGVNPKTFKLEIALLRTHTPYVLVLDDDSRLSGLSLRNLAAALAWSELSTALPCYRDDPRRAARLLAAFVNNNAAVTYLALLPFARPVTINGMCYMMRRDYLLRIGGFAGIRGELTDDLALAEMVIQQGGRIHQCAAAVEVHTSIRDLHGYLQQMHRWCLFAMLAMRRQSAKLLLAIAFLHGIHPWILMGLIATALLVPSPANVGALFGVFLLRAAVLVFMQWRVSGRPRMRPVLSILSELLLPLHFVHALVQRTIRWRTRRYAVSSSGLFRAVP